MILDNQVFWGERNISDGNLIANEVMHEAKANAKRKGCLIFKVDFEKAYDSMENFDIHVA